MQPVKTTALRANEAARNLNAGNKRRSWEHGHVPYRYRAEEGLVAEEIAATPRNAGFVAGVRKPYFLACKCCQAHFISLLICASPCSPAG